MPCRRCCGPACSWTGRASSAGSASPSRCSPRRAAVPKRRSTSWRRPPRRRAGGRRTRGAFGRYFEDVLETAAAGGGVRRGRSCTGPCGTGSRLFTGPCGTGSRHSTGPCRTGSRPSTRPCGTDSGPLGIPPGGDPEGWRGGGWLPTAFRAASRFRTRRRASSRPTSVGWRRRGPPSPCRSAAGSRPRRSPAGSRSRERACSRRSRSSASPSACCGPRRREARPRPARVLDADLLMEAVRRADLLLLHLADPEALARRISRGEAAEGPCAAW